MDSQSIKQSSTYFKGCVEQILTVLDKVLDWGIYTDKEMFADKIKRLRLATELVNTMVDNNIDIENLLRVLNESVSLTHQSVNPNWLEYPNRVEARFSHCELVVECAKTIIKINSQSTKPITTTTATTASIKLDKI